MSEHAHGRKHRWGHAALWGAGIVVIGGVALMWSWNVFAVEFLQAPAMKFRHALAAEVLLGFGAATLALAGRMRLGRRHRTAA